MKTGAGMRIVKRNRVCMALALCMLFLLTGLTATYGDEPRGAGSNRGDSDRLNLEDMIDGLKLKPGQEDTVIPVLEEDFQKRHEILEKFRNAMMEGRGGAERPREARNNDMQRSTRIDLEIELIKLREETGSSLSSLLSKKQMKRWNKLMDKLHKEIKSDARPPERKPGGPGQGGGRPPGMKGMDQ